MAALPLHANVWLGFATGSRYGLSMSSNAKCSRYGLSINSSSNVKCLRSGSLSRHGWRSSQALVVCASNQKEVVESKGLAYDGPGKGGQWLSSTTRHVRLYVGVVDPETDAMDQTQLDKLTLMLDTDDEFIWPEDKVDKVHDYFRELVAAYAGAPLNEYTLRLIGSDIEHYIRKLLLAKEITYNLNCRVLNFSMGKPRYESGIIEGDDD